MGSVYGNYPLVMTNIAIENGHRNSELDDSDGEAGRESAGR